MPYTFQVTLDCVDPHRQADWWADALGWQVEPSDEAFIRQMIAEGQAREEDTTTHDGVLVWKEGAAVVNPDAAAGTPRLYLQAVREGKVAKNRMHLDVRVGDDDVATVVRRLTELGASVLHEGRQGPHTWMTLADPEGNEFCISR
jgi:hypothetical protein